jgi:hypothetical protein
MGLREKFLDERTQHKARIEVALGTEERRVSRRERKKECAKLECTLLGS